MSGGLTLDFRDANQKTPVQDPTYIGNAVHADVHALRFVNAPGGVELWVGCDGGVFRSRRGGDRHTFTPCNGGLAVLECGYVTSHPTNDALVVSGTQDNGKLIRVGDTVWLHWGPGGGDGGGVAFHPVKPAYFAAQYTGASWSSNGLLTAPVLRTTGTNRTDSEKFENQFSSFYSGCDVRQVGATPQTRLALGTHRVWLADAWDPDPPAPAPGARNFTRWVTLDSGNDPRSSDDTAKDTFEKDTNTGVVIACRFGSDDRLYALCMRAVMVFNRQADGKWKRKVVSFHTKKCTSYKNDDIPQPTSPYLPPLGSWSDLAVYDATRGADGAFYVATTGHVKVDDNTFTDSPRMDTLWWYDGSGVWHPTGLRNSPKGTMAPAYTVVCDPDDRNIVYVGTALGVWRGVLTPAGPTWDWGLFANGLPEAAIQDLSFHRNGAVKILRAALQARGVWEVDLSAAPSPRGRTYLRVHAYDARRTLPTTLDNPTPANVGDTAIYSWHASPDVRLRRAPLTAAEAAPLWPGGATWAGATPRPRDLWIFQTALHRQDPLCRPTGQWTRQFQACLERENAGEGNTVSSGRWTRVVTQANVFSAPWDGAEPTEADLHELSFERTDIGTTVLIGPPRVSREVPPVVVLERARYNVDVLVHHRDSRPVARTGVRVALLSRPIAGDPNTWGALAISAQWRTRVEQFVSGNALPAGWALPDSWNVADGSTAPRQPLADIDARHPRTVTFEVDFSTAPRPSQWILLAVVSTGADAFTAAATPAATLRDLALSSHHIAVRAATLA